MTGLINRLKSYFINRTVIKNEESNIIEYLKEQAPKDQLKVKIDKEKLNKATKLLNTLSNIDRLNIIQEVDNTDNTGLAAIWNRIEDLRYSGQYHFKMLRQSGVLTEEKQNNTIICKVNYKLLESVETAVNNFTNHK